MELELIDVVEDILDLDPNMRFAAILDLDGQILESILKQQKTSLESQKQLEQFCLDAAKRRDMREQFNDSLGRVRYVHVERENVTQITVYLKNNTIFVTMEPELSNDRKLELVNKIKSITAEL